MGRPDRMLNLFRYGRIQSPIMWDVIGVSTYLTGCMLYFYIPMIPDLGLLADMEFLPNWRRRLYKALSLGWKGTAHQKEMLEKAVSTMAVFIIPLAVSVHTVVSWIFSMTLRPGWNSSIFGPYFVVGAIYSGAAAVIVSMYTLRRIFHLEDYIAPSHFRNLGLLLLSFSLAYLYFNINEYLTVGYKLEGADRALLASLFSGEYATIFWTAQALCIVIPLSMMLPVFFFKRYDKFIIPTVVTASGLVIIGAWMKRYIIVVPTLRSPFLPLEQTLPSTWRHYTPTEVEWSITAGAVAAFLIIYTLISKLFPVISIWETREDDQEQEARAATAVPATPERSFGWVKRAGEISIVLAVAFLCLSGRPARAATPEANAKTQLKATVISVEADTAPVTAKLDFSRTPGETAAEHVAQAQPQHQPPTFLYAGRMPFPFSFGGGSDDDDENAALPPVLNLIAALREAAGNPLASKPVEFLLKTSFGSLSFGNQTTAPDGKAHLSIQDRRYGDYMLEAVFHGDKEFAQATNGIPIKFAPRPEPSLPAVNVLATPYATPAIAMPFIIFYGLMWVVFIYGFGYLILYRMRREPSAH